MGIYLDAAATAIHRPPSVKTAMLHALENYGNPGRGSHEYSLQASRCVQKCRKTVAGLFGASASQLQFTSGATESLNWAISAVVAPGDHVIATYLEHNAVLRPLYHVAELDVVDVGDIAQYIRPDTKAVVVSTASNVTGQVVDLAPITAVCKHHGIPLIVDAAQTAGVLPISLADADIICFTGHKHLFAPQGIGGIVAKKALPPIKLGGTGTDTFYKKMPDHQESGTLNTPAIAGLLAGVEYIMASGMDRLLAKALAVANTFVERLENVTVYSPARLALPIVAINIGDMPSAQVADILATEYNIAVRGGGHCAPMLHTKYNTVEQGMVRFSFSSYNTAEEAILAASAINQIANQIQSQLS